MKLAFKISIILAVLIAVPMISTAVFSLSDSDINITINPNNPEPYQNATITLSSYATDLNKAFIEWRSGNNLILSGYGRISYSFKTLGDGMSTSFDITIKPSDSDQTIIKNILVTPSTVDMLWQAVDGYTPLFYRGKSFSSSEGLIKVVAMPDSQNKDNTYVWKREDTTVTDASGYGKNSFTFINDYLSTEENVSVTASSTNSQYNATQSIKIPIVSPQIIFYEKLPGEGVLYGNALGSETTMDQSKNEMTIVAEPYFLNTKGNENLYTYSWMINGETTDTPAKKTEMTIRPTSRGGYATINLTLENVSRLFQKASGQLKINL